MPAQKGIKVIAKNRAAFHNYYIEERYESGIELCGTEVKSIRAGRVNLKDAFCQVKNGELFVYGMHVSPYEKGNIFNREPRRDRRLLMHKREIMRLYGRDQAGRLCADPSVPLFQEFPCEGRNRFGKR